MKHILKILLLVFFVTSFQTFAQIGNWEVYDEMDYPVARGQLVVANDIIYVLGGYSQNLQRTVDWIQKYNPIIDGVWKDFGNMQLSRGGFTAGSYQGSIYYCGGVIESLPNSSSMEKWDFTQVGNIIENNVNFTRTYAAGKISGSYYYLIGGNPTSSTNFLPYIVSVNMSNFNVTTLEDNVYSGVALPEHQMVASLSNSLYIFGGVIYGISQDIYKFDLTSNTLEKLPIQLYDPRAAGAAVSLPMYNKILIIGGFNENNNSLSSVEVFTITDSGYEISQGPELNIARSALMAGKTSTDIFVMGGFDENGNVVSAVEKIEYLSPTGIDDNMVIDDFKLEQNYPNPFNPTTNIAFQLNQSAEVSLDVYSILGEHIQNIVSKEHTTGSYVYQWNGTDQLGQPVPSGIYIYKITTESFSKSNKMVLLK